MDNSRSMLCGQPAVVEGKDQKKNGVGKFKSFFFNSVK